MDEYIVDASPTKEFFIEMLTKDIKLERAILDLIDNSIDGAKRECDDDFSGKFIKIVLDSEKFIIEDNCGGFSKIIAREYAFKFGRAKKNTTENDSTENNTIDYSIGRFGVGMKRTLFKLGNEFSVQSFTEDEFFEVKVDVNTWKISPKWQFEINDQDMNNRPKEKGTKIEVKNLHNDVKADFAIENKIRILMAEVQNSLSEILLKGLKILINGIEIEPSSREIICDENIGVEYIKFLVDEVEVRIIAGILESKPVDAGWYIYCNDRLVLEADKTKLSGWEGKSEDEPDAPPQFHPSFSMFRGYVFFKAKDPIKLPLTTTKTGIDYDSGIYRFTLMHMRKIIKKITKELRKVEDKKDREKIYKTYDKCNVIDLYKNLKSSNNLDFYFNVQLETEDKENLSTIHYKKPKDEVDALRKMLNLSSNAALGEFTYEYYKDMELG